MLVASSGVGVQLIACYQLRNTWLFRPGSPLSLSLLVDGLRVRGAGLAAQRRSAFPALMGFLATSSPWPLPCRAFAASGNCSGVSSQRSSGPTVAAGIGLPDTFGTAPWWSASITTLCDDQAGQVSGNRQGPTMIQPRRRGKVIFAANHATPPPLAWWLHTSRQVHGRPAHASHARPERGRRQRRRWRWRCDLIRHRRGTFTAFAMRHRHRSIDSTPPACRVRLACVC